jgi:hypothetical protein
MVNWAKICVIGRYFLAAATKILDAFLGGDIASGSDIQRRAILNTGYLNLQLLETIQTQLLEIYVVNRPCIDISSSRRLLLIPTIPRISGYIKVNDFYTRDHMDLSVATSSLVLAGSYNVSTELVLRSYLKCSKRSHLNLSPLPLSSNVHSGKTTPTISMMISAPAA